MFERQIGIDLGTVNVLVYVSGRGIVLQEPSVVAISIRDNKIVAVGQEARDMLGRTPESIEVARPMRDGVIADYVVTEAMLRYFIRRVIGRNPLFRPRVMISTPKGVTSVESRAVHDAAMQAGAKEAYLIPEPLAAAYGAGLPIGTPIGQHGHRHRRRHHRGRGRLDERYRRVEQRPRGRHPHRRSDHQLRAQEVQPDHRRADRRRDQDPDRQRAAAGSRNWTWKCAGATRWPACPRRSASPPAR